MKKVEKKTRLQETLEFLASYSLFVPHNPNTREAIRFFVHSGNRYKLGGVTPSERAASLRKITRELQGQLVTHEKSNNEQGPLRVLYVLPKTEREIEKQIMDRASDKKGILETKPISPFKVCVKSSSLGKPCVIPLDMLRVVEGGEE